ncbi:iron-sulfur cluster assembly scaffold protein [Megalodesulfovibrio paquesii]
MSHRHMTEEELASLPGQFLEKLVSQRHLGMLPDPDGIAEMTGSCGDSMLVQLRMAGSVIQEMRALVRGCAYTTACATALGDMVVGKSAEEALWIEPDQLAESLGGLPDDHHHCARLALNTLGEAISSWQGQVLTPKMPKQITPTILMVTPRLPDIAPFLQGLGSSGKALRHVETGEAALAFVSNSPPQLVIFDHILPDGDPLAFAGKLLRINAMVNAAVLDPRSEDEFHEASEGLGLLGHLPLMPDDADGRALAQKLATVLGEK